MSEDKNKDNIINNLEENENSAINAENFSDSNNENVQEEVKQEVTNLSDTPMNINSPVVEGENMSETVSDEIADNNPDIEKSDFKENQSNNSSEELKEDFKSNSLPDQKESNYQVSLVDENTLKVKVTTANSVSVDFSVKDKSNTESVEEMQSNKIFIHPRHGSLRQEVEILVKIGDIKATNKDVTVIQSKPEQQKSKLTPNPLVADLIQRFGKSKPAQEEEIPNGLKTQDQILEDKLVKKNPWIINREFMRKNLQYGFYAANIIIIIFSIIVFAIASGKKPDPNVPEEQKRLIVMQDLPENLNQLNQQVDDPNRPPEQEKESTTGTDVTTPQIKTPKIRPPKVIVPKVDSDTNISSINKELDSLRKKNITGNTNGSLDSGKINTSLMPDSLLKNLADNEVGLIGKFPPNWKQIDSRAININQKEFTGIILVDTTAKRKEEAVNMSIQLDPKGSYFNTYKFEKVLAEDSLRTLFNIDPKIEGNLTYWRFYVASKSGNVFISSYVEPGSFDKYKPEIEQVVKSIYIKLPEKK